MKSMSLSAIFAATLALSASLAFTETQAGERHVLRSSGQGSVQHGRVRVADGQGNARTVRGASLQGNAGGSLERGASRSRSADGSRQSERHLSATGSPGSTLQSNGSLSYSAESGLSQNRSATATNAATGNSVQAGTSYSRDSGLSHSVACLDASGASIACPSR